jgi:hypothetical protein
MKYTIITLLLFCTISLGAQSEYESSKEFPFGKVNPNAPEQTADYEILIGECECKSESRNPDRTWADPVDLIWRWKYIMNGFAVQDETIKTDGKHSGSIRQYNKDSLNWYVHYYASNAPTSKLSTWEGSKNEDGNIVLYKDQKAPNGTDGYSRLTFYDIDEKGYKWVGEWVDKTETVVFPFWKITCLRKE